MTVAVGILIYFSHARRSEQLSRLGLDPNVLAEPSIAEYLVRSVGALFLPIVTIVMIGICGTWSHRRMTVRLADDDLDLVRRVARAVYRVGLVGLIAGVVVLVTSQIRPDAADLSPVFGLLVLAGAILLMMYGHVLACAHRARRPAAERRSPVPDIARLLLAGALALLLLLAAADRFARHIGNELATKLEGCKESVDPPCPQGDIQDVVLYANRSLQIDSSDATRTPLKLEEGDDGYRERYDGLRLLFADGESYLLISKRWGQPDGRIIIVRRDDVRVEFLHGVHHP